MLNIRLCWTLSKGRNLCLDRRPTESYHQQAKRKQSDLKDRNNPDVVMGPNNNRTRRRRIHPLLSKNTIIKPTGVLMCRLSVSAEMYTCTESNTHAHIFALTTKGKCGWPWTATAQQSFHGDAPEMLTQTSCSFHCISQLVRLIIVLVETQKNCFLQSFAVITREVDDNCAK